MAFEVLIRPPANIPSGVDQDRLACGIPQIFEMLPTYCSSLRHVEMKDDRIQIRQGR